ncbi:phosphatidate cytidylyltransferase [Fusobacterium nucleatum]|uniref:phosphatidate cytidylyltransferase n=1 Tax=Fusobacterium nucleatum TaxID=851 RepID=UPI00235FC8C7|nr:phosphatidate cytidylyltransferase [Fusobacterium nucleatum]WDA46270.1 phosphatidate cytidylyltransferase [Fusobacterium nucleatum]
MLIAMLVVDILALIILFFIKKKISEKKFNNIVQRIFTWFIIIILFLLGSINRICMLMLFGLISILSFKEFLQFAYIKYDNELKIYNLTVNLIFYIGIYFKNTYILLILFLFICLKFYKRGFIIFAFFITTYLIGSITYIDDLNFIINYLILVELNDVFQYISGNILGKRKITPKISPNKTVEGLIGGIILTTLTATLLKNFVNINFQVKFIPYICLIGFIGDVFISALKRKVNLKDSGTLLLGHGGILDRVDSLIFTAPIILLIFKL